MPLTTFQARVAKILSGNRSKDSYLAGGAAMHFEPNSIRYSQDLDYFHHSEVLVAEAFKADTVSLKSGGIELKTEIAIPGYIRATARSENEVTKIEWAHESAWLFMPVQFVSDLGFVLHPVDLAVNKVLALAGRDEPRDFLDVIHASKEILPLPGLVWAASGKDPGFTPHSLLELLQRKGKYRSEDFSRLHLNVDVDLPAMKQAWLEELAEVRSVINYLPDDELGCLYFDAIKKSFVIPTEKRPKEILPHFATHGGVLPQVLTGPWAE